MTTIFKFLKNYHNAFICSVFFGFLIWFLIYLLLPVITTPLSKETILFICSSVVVFVCGYFVFPVKLLDFHKNPETKTHIEILFILAFLGLTFRYLDLFYFRGLSLKNMYFENKMVDFKMASKSPFLITTLATLRALSPIPLLYVILSKNKNRLYLIFSIILIIYSSLEIFLFGTRKPLFHLVVLIVFAFVYSNINFRFNYKKIIFYSFIVFLFLGLFSFFILNKRVNETQKKENALVEVVYSRYNDFVKIKEEKINQFEVNQNSLNTKVQIMLYHTGQYIIHGFYELDYIIKNDFPKANGIYSFNPVFKLLNRLEITNKDLNTMKYHPRDYVYTSFYGSFFIDFGWFALIPMFLFGCFQRIIFNLSQYSNIAKVFFIILLSVNLVMPIFNLVSGSGLYLFIFMSLILMLGIKSIKTSLR